jgi:hypothetical protein
MEVRVNENNQGYRGTSISVPERSLVKKLMGPELRAIMRGHESFGGGQNITPIQ